MKARKEPEIITANRLVDGDVVYLTAALTWADDIAQARVIPPEEDIAPFLEKGEADKAAQIVVDVYAFPVALDEGSTPRPVSAREIIRAAGPTVRLDLGKQADA